MDKKEILDAIAPCSLCCYTCGAKKDGAISKYSKILLDYHKGYYQFKSRLPLKHKKQILKEDKRFLQELEKKTNGGCNGCRNGEHSKYCIKGCFILECTKAQGIVFCGECSKFPCDNCKQLFSDKSICMKNNIYSDWLYGNERIKLVGAEQYYREAISHSHYQSFKNDEFK